MKHSQMVLCNQPSGGVKLHIIPLCSHIFFIPLSPCHHGLTISADQVGRELGRLHRSNAAGPDGISPRLLKAHGEQMCEVDVCPAEFQPKNETRTSSCWVEDFLPGPGPQDKPANILL